ncbi:MAG: hypothetical protein NPIRA04_34430 [Nitrospirales bacterium]|nr:MAG: hypothetical protein NPIRA04_34430 [Nitrospirales bacterium]
MAQVGLYDVWETKVTNSKKYSNPFDYNVIELRATFTSPSGKKFNFFGFYDGNGNGGQNGNVWKLRFMPDKVGTWKYSYSWTDGTSGGSGSFTVVDTGLPGPLKVATDNSWYFMTSKGKPFDFRGYDLHVVAKSTATRKILSEVSRVKNLLKTQVIDHGYNFTMLDGVTNRARQTNRVNTWKESWWLNTTDTKTFDISVWKAYEEILTLAKDKNVYIINFNGMIHQPDRYNVQDFKVFLRYWVARVAPFYNYFGWSPTWEWLDIWSASEVNQIMQYVYDLDPWKRMLSSHDCSHNSFSSWLRFSMRQSQSRDVFNGNSRNAPWNQFSNLKPKCGSDSGIGSKFVNKPIVGSEDLWEIPSGNWKQPRNRTEVRRGAWGILMAGVMPLYSEWNPEISGGGTGEPDIRRMFDFFYSKTKYREYKQLNSLVSKSNRQIASGKEGLEYLVYDENGGSISINLSGVGSSNTFDVLWYNPTTGATQNGGKVTGGSSRTLNSPISGDTVLLLTRGDADTTPPKAPTGLSIR